MITYMMMQGLAKGLLNQDFVIGGIIADIIILGIVTNTILEIVRKRSK